MMFIYSSLLMWVVFQVLITGSQTKPHATPSEDACVDNSPNCASSIIQCHTNSYVQGRCKKTCNLCENKPDACVDISPNCARNIIQCHNNSYVQGRCKKTCNLCENKPAPHVCAGDAVAFGSQCLTFSGEDDKLIWSDAAAACVSNGGRLAILEHPVDVADYVAANYPRGTIIWVGASDAANEGSWMWIDGQPSGDQIPWYGMEPDGGNGENCLVIWGGHGFADYQCSATHSAHRYICEYGNLDAESTSVIPDLPLF